MGNSFVDSSISVCKSVAGKFLKKEEPKSNQKIERLFFPEANIRLCYGEKESIYRFPEIADGLALLGEQFPRQIYRIVEERYSLNVCTEDSCSILANFVFRDRYSISNKKSIVYLTFNMKKQESYIGILTMNVFLLGHPLHRLSDFAVFDMRAITEADIGFDINILHEKMELCLGDKQMFFKSFYLMEGLPFRYVNDNYMRYLCGFKQKAKHGNRILLDYILPEDKNEYIHFLQRNAQTKQIYTNIHRSISNTTEKFIWVWEIGIICRYGQTMVVNSFSNILDLASSATLLEKNIKYIDVNTNKIVEDNDVYFELDKSIRFYPVCRAVIIDNNKIFLTPLESELLLIMVKSKPRLVTLPEFCGSLWGDVYDESYNTTIKVHICNLRKKLKRYINIVNKKQVGYGLQILQKEGFPGVGSSCEEDIRTRAK